MLRAITLRDQDPRLMKDLDEIQTPLRRALGYCWWGRWSRHPAVRCWMFWVLAWWSHEWKSLQGKNFNNGERLQHIAILRYHEWKLMMLIAYERATDALISHRRLLFLLFFALPPHHGKEWEILRIGPGESLTVQGQKEEGELRQLDEEDGTKERIANVWNYEDEVWWSLTMVLVTWTGALFFVFYTGECFSLGWELGGNITFAQQQTILGKLSFYW